MGFKNIDCTRLNETEVAAFLGECIPPALLPWEVPSASGPGAWTGHPHQCPHQTLWILPSNRLSERTVPDTRLLEEAGTDLHPLGSTLC